jgi:molecular chaperone DnaK
METLTTAQHKAAEAMYRQAGTPGGDAGAAGGAGPTPGASGGGAPRPDDVIDAEVVDEERKG